MPCRKSSGSGWSSRPACARSRSSDGGRVVGESMSSSGSRAPVLRRSASVWIAMTSRKLRPGLISSVDFGPSSPMLVPSPPLSFTTARRSSTARVVASSGSGRSSSRGSGSTGESSSPGSVPAPASASCASRRRNAASSIGCAPAFSSLTTAGWSALTDAGSTMVMRGRLRSREVGRRGSVARPVRSRPTLAKGPDTPGRRRRPWPGRLVMRARRSRAHAACRRTMGP